MLRVGFLEHLPYRVHIKVILLYDVVHYPAELAFLIKRASLDNIEALHEFEKVNCPVLSFPVEIHEYLDHEGVILDIGHLPPELFKLSHIQTLSCLSESGVHRHYVPDFGLCIPRDLQQAVHAVPLDKQKVVSAILNIGVEVI